VTEIASLRILVVEDEMLIAMMLQSLVEELGHRVVYRASTAAEALAIVDADHSQLDAATLDINLDGEHTDEVANALFARGIPFIITTGYDDPKLLAGFPVQPIIHKPFVPRQLDEAIRRLELRKMEPS
jgi:CheY-like chemotaxis protein